MKTKIIALLLCIFTMNVMAQTQISREKCKTCGKPISQCPQKGNHSESVGYYVIFKCNVPTAKLYIDGNAYGEVSGSRFLEADEHVIKLEAAGYEEFIDTIYVDSKHLSYSFIMNKKQQVEIATVPITILEENELVVASDSEANREDIKCVKITDDVTIELVFVQGGSFMMGSSVSNSVYKNEHPAHKVVLNDFYIGKYEVTQALWTAVMGKNPSRYKGYDLPVERVSWNDCQRFISELNRLTGLNFCLPTEAEWEYAARGGNKSQNYLYSGGNDANEVAWNCVNSNGRTHPVGKKKANELGIYDMSGNVWELCNDRYDSNYYKNSPIEDPTGAQKGRRVRRGGDYGYMIASCRSVYRDNIKPFDQDNGTGFRLVLQIDRKD